MKPWLKFTVFLTMTVVVAAIWFYGSHLQSKPTGKIVNDFPDKEVCSLGCGVGWNTYVTLGNTYNQTQWHAKENDLIEWVIDPKAVGSFRFDGLYYIGNGIKDLEMCLNGKILEGNLKDGQYRLNKDEYVVAGDLITVKIISTYGDGVIQSIQPTGVH